ncbi:ABC transporter substrate-binding protein [Haloarcula sp. CBA1127]|uniref:ABC transporter substrate-binding protein n=1 Tax=Haloarcula sp. CBA1127 TaxID=1765055 RepID=UPI00073F5392|nr:ABC transporter substrate-binding protein [Haloarcula sp. CBA1127]
MSQDVDASGTPTVSRRRMLQTTGAATLTALAGCNTGTNDGASSGGGGGAPDPVRERVDVDVDEIQEGGTLRFGLGAGIDSFDPSYSTSAPAGNVQELVYEQIITQDAAGTVYPWLAKSWERVDVQEVEDGDYEPYMVSADTDDDGNLVADEQIIIRNTDAGEVLTVNEAPDAVEDGTYGIQYQAELHEGVTFHNGEEMTAENVARSYEVLENSSISAQTFDSFLYAEAVDDYTVNIYGQKPDAEADNQLVSYVYPMEHIEEYPDTGADPRNDHTPIGTGPFQFESYETEERAEFSSFDDYWVDDLGLDALEWWDGPDGFPTSPVVDEVVVAIVQDNATRAAALNNGEIDLTYGLNTGTYGEYRSAEDFRLSVTNAGAYNFLQYPVTQSPWGDPRIRRGVNQLIPRAQIAENIYNGYRNPAYTPLPEMAAKAGTVDYEALTEELRPQTEQNTEAATELLQEAVDDLGVETPIEATIETNATDDRLREAELIAQVLSNTEFFDISVEDFEFTTFIQRILGSEYYKQGNIVLIGLSGTFNPGSFYDAVNSIDNFGQCCNFNRIDTPELDEVATEARFSVEAVEDSQFRGEQYDKVWQGLIEQAPNSYTVFGTNVTALSTEYVGYNTYTFSSSILPYGLHAPEDQQVAYLNRE